MILVRVDPGPGAALLPQPQSDLDEPTPEFSADWAELVPELPGNSDDTVITKHQWGAFHATALDLHLRRHGVRTLILGGISTNLGVESTACEAFDHGYEQIFAEDAMTAHAAEDHEHTIRRLFPRIGRVRRTAQLLDGIAGARSPGHGVS